MYENDYSSWPQAFAMLVVLSALGSLLISLVQANRARRRMMRWWCLVPVLFAVSVGIWAALYAENIEPITPLLIVPVLTLVLLPPWAVAGAVVFAASRRIQHLIKREP